MKDLLPVIHELTESSTPFVTTKVIQTWGSSPRPVGSYMIVDRDSNMSGSVSGGCVEGAVVKESLDILKGGTSRQLDYGVSDDDAWTVGLACGGRIRLYAEPFMGYDPRIEEQEVWQSLHESLVNNRSAVLVTKLNEASQHSLVLDDRIVGYSLPENIVSEARSSLTERRHKLVEDDAEYFIEVYPRRSQMFIIGAAHLTSSLIDLAKLYGFETIVIDPRDAFATSTRFNTPPDVIHNTYPAEVLSEYPLDAQTFAVVLSHDPKIDDNALEVLLPSDAAYIGALGSKKTHAKRIARLTAAGFTEEQLSCIHAPIGENINAMSPPEIALSIMAQIIKVKNEFARKR